MKVKTVFSTVYGTNIFLWIVNMLSPGYVVAGPLEIYPIGKVEGTYMDQEKIELVEYFIAKGKKRLRKRISQRL